MEIGIIGAGSVGLYLGLILSHAGAKVRLIDRRDLSASRDSFLAIDIKGVAHRPSSNLTTSTDVRDLATVSVCLVAVKSGDTDVVARDLAPVLEAEATMVSFQNGLHNPSILRNHLASDVVPGVVGFNVVRSGATVRQHTAGPLFVGPGSAASPRRLVELQRLFRSVGLGLRIRADIENVMAGKLLMNLSNGVCAATGLSVAETLSDRDARWCFARCIREGVIVLRAAGRNPTRVVALSPAWVARVLSLPDLIISPASRALVSTTQGARPSTLQDLDAGRPTEISVLNGEIVALARRHQLPAPANESVLEAVQAHEAAIRDGRPVEFVRPADLRRRVEQRTQAIRARG